MNGLDNLLKIDSEWCKADKVIHCIFVLLFLHQVSV